MADTGAIDAAVFTALGADATLKTLCPDGVWRNNAPQSKTRFVVVVQAAAADSDLFQGPAFETITYAVTAVLKDQSATPASNAAARIRVVMESITTVSGYVLTIVKRLEPIRYSEPDPVNPDLFWQHFGGLFEVMVTPA